MVYNASAQKLGKFEYEKKKKKFWVVYLWKVVKVEQ